MTILSILIKDPCPVCGERTVYCEFDDGEPTSSDNVFVFTHDCRSCGDHRSVSHVVGYGQETALDWICDFCGRDCFKTAPRNALSSNRNDPNQGESQPPVEDEQEWLALAVAGDRIKIVSLSYDGTYRLLDGLEHQHDILYLTPGMLALQEAIEELEEMVNDSRARETDFQKFFEEHPYFILNEDYRQLYSHVVLTRDEGSTLIPDFMLEPVERSRLCDLLDIKCPTARVFVLKKNRIRFSAAVAEGRAQLLEYSRYFDEKKHQERIYRAYGLRCWRPRMFLIIGRLGPIDAFQRRFVETSMEDLQVVTYDGILKKNKRRLERLRIGKMMLKS